MRDRKEILDFVNHASTGDGWTRRHDIATLEVLLDIRDLLTPPRVLTEVDLVAIIKASKKGNE